MKTLVINGSVRKDKSITLKIVNAFLEGLSPEESKEIRLYDKKISPCLADFSCWFRTPGQCVYKDDVREIHAEMEKADLVIWSVPLYAFGLPSVMTMFLERSIFHLRPAIVPDEFGRSKHPGIAEEPWKHMVFMSGALPDTDGNFDAAVLRMRRIYGETVPVITCPESTLFQYRKSEALNRLTQQYLETAREAGRRMREEGRIPEEIMETLNSCMMPREEYIAFINGR